VLVVPPLAEEMNKTRRMVSLTMDSLAALGVASVVVDLSGTGDSSGELVEEDWGCWLRDLSAASTWSASHGVFITKVLATRAGCLLAAAWMRANPELVRHAVFWQPVVDGSRHVDQLLRTRMAASMAGSGPRQSIAALRQQLQTDGRLEIGGYEWPSSLLAMIDAQRLPALCGAGTPRIDWIDVPRNDDAPVSAPIAQALGGMQQAGVDIRLRRVPGEPFWASVEVVTTPALIDVTVQLLAEPV
jgi:exosortase A-associated hydrolase 2